MEQITIFGSTGFVGRKLIKKAVSSGYKVKTLVRDASKIQGFNDHVEIIEGSYFDTTSVLKALDGSSVVLSTIGPPMKGKVSNQDINKYHSSLGFILDQMFINGQTKFINIGGAGIKRRNEKLPMPRKFMRLMLNLMAKHVVKIKDGELELLENSKLNWISVRPPMIKENQKGKLVFHETNFLGMAVDVDKLCDFMLDCIKNNKWDKKAPVVGTK